MILSKDQSEILKMFSDLSFDSQRHLYFWRGRQVPESVSAKVEEHAAKFNADKVLPYSALKASRQEGREVSVHELRKRWQSINQTACSLGTQTHTFMENYTGLETPTTPQEEAGVKYIKSLAGKYRISFRELRAYSRKYNYAGTMDLPLEIVDTGEYLIDDYKTNGDLFKAYEMMKPPFEYLESSPYNKYQFQLSYYQIMLEEVGMKIAGRRIVHLRADSEFKIYDLADFTNELRDYMNNRHKYFNYN